MPYWEGPIQDDLRAGETVLVTAHGDSLRGLVKHLDGISDEDIAALNIPTGQPLVYTLGDDFMPTKPGEYLDPEAAAEAAAAVAKAQGRYGTVFRARRVPREVGDARGGYRPVARSSCSSSVLGDVPLTGDEVDDPVGYRHPWSAKRCGRSDRPRHVDRCLGAVLPGACRSGG